MELQLPGFFDLQVNGFGGVDFNIVGLTDDDLIRAAQLQRKTGVTRFLPTLITSTFEAFAAPARVIANTKEAAVAGLHMEGPYIARAAKGAHPEACVCDASIEDFKRRQDAAGGRIRLVTLAPEIPGALPLIEYLVASGVAVALGHMAASPQDIRNGIAAGARLSTHLGNGTPAGLPKFPNLIWEQMASDELSATLIVDGHHLPSSVVRSMVRAKTPARTILITDAIVAAGLAPGNYALGEQQVELSSEGKVTLRGTQKLAGAALKMNDAVANTAVATGLSIVEAAALASHNPAAFMGEQPVGTLSARWDQQSGRLEIVAVQG